MRDWRYRRDVVSFFWRKWLSTFLTVLGHNFQFPQHSNRIDLLDIFYEDNRAENKVGFVTEPLQALIPILDHPFEERHLGTS